MSYNLIRAAQQEAIENLKYFVAEFFDGSLQRCLELDELLWQVRLTKGHTPEMFHVETKTDTAEPYVIDLEELGL